MTGRASGAKGREVSGTVSVNEQRSSWSEACVSRAYSTLVGLEVKERDRKDFRVFEL